MRAPVLRTALLRRVPWLAAPLALTAACGPGETACERAPGIACVWAGTGDLAFDGDGRDRREASFYWPLDVEFAPDGTGYVIDWNNHVVRHVLADGIVETVVGGVPAFPGDGPPDGADLMAPGAPGTTVLLNHPTDIQFEPDGTMLLMAWHNHKLRVWDPATKLAFVQGGRGGGFDGDGDPIGMVRFNQPKALVRAPDGTLFVLDQRNQRIRKIAPDGVVTTVAGTGEAGFAGDSGPPAMAQLRFKAGGNPEPSSALAMDADGRLYVSDGKNHRLRRIDFVADTIETIAGTGTAGFSGDGGPAVDAAIDDVRDLEFGPDGLLYVADTGNHRIRVIDLTTGLITTIAGGAAVDAMRDGVSPAELTFNRPAGIGFGPDGALYIADTLHSRIVEVPR